MHLKFFFEENHHEIRLRKTQPTKYFYGELLSQFVLLKISNS